MTEKVSCYRGTTVFLWSVETAAATAVQSSPDTVPGGQLSDLYS